MLEPYDDRLVVILVKYAEHETTGVGPGSIPPKGVSRDPFLRTMFRGNGCGIVSVCQRDSAASQWGD